VYNATCSNKDKQATDETCFISKFQNTDIREQHFTPKTKLLLKHHPRQKRKNMK